MDHSGTSNAPLEEATKMITDNASSKDVSVNMESEDFKVLGSRKRANVQKVTPSLPKWMSTSIKFDGDIVNNCSDLDHFHASIDQTLLNNLETNDIVKLFPVQKTLIPYLAETFLKLKHTQPSDVCVLSPTGSGKTLAYVIPIVNYLLKRVVTQIRALVILPVSDLATQVYKVFQTMCKGTTLRVGLATSSSSKKNAQSGASQFYRSTLDSMNSICMVDILVATPGKLIDLIEQDNCFNLHHLEILIIDEADRMMNETQFQWLREIEQSVFDSNRKHICACSCLTIPKSKNHFSNIDLACACSISQSQVLRKSLVKILFSATLSTDPEKIDGLSLYHPILFNVCEEEGNILQKVPLQNLPTNLKELMIITDKDKKPLIIWHLIKALNYRRVLCFTDSVNSTHRLFKLMKQIPEIVVSEFSSKQNIKKRTKILSQFENGTVDMIISTDIFARGLDVDGINCVICYDPPRNETAYIHRIGRTARAGKEGTAISLVTPDQLKHFTIVSRRAHKSEKKQIEKLSIRASEMKPHLPQYREALKLLENEVHSEEKSNYLRKRKQISNSKFSNSKGRKGSHKSTLPN